MCSYPNIIWGGGSGTDSSADLCLGMAKELMYSF